MLSNNVCKNIFIHISFHVLVLKLHMFQYVGQHFNIFLLRLKSNAVRLKDNSIANLNYTRKAIKYLNYAADVVSVVIYNVIADMVLKQP